MRGISLIFVIALLAMAACGPPHQPESESAGTQAGSSSASAAMTWTDSDGTTHQLPDGIDAVVSLAPSITEWTFALGAGNYVKGRTDFCRWPSEVAAIPSVGGLSTPSIEKILSMKPSIILASGLTPKPVVKQLRQYGIPAARLDFSSTARIGDSVGRLADLFNIPESDAPIVQSWKTHFSGGEKPQLSGRPPGVVVLFGTSGLFCAGSGTFVEDLVEFHGGRNLPSTLDSSNWPEVAEETLLGWKPDIIIVHFDEDIPEEAGLSRFMSRWGIRPLWPEIPALRHGRVHVITDSRLSVPGPRILSVSDDFQKWIGEAQILEGKSR